MSRAVLGATAAAEGLGPLLNALQTLALYAAISGRAPVIPSVPCSSGWIRPGLMTLAGVADDYVLQARPASPSRCLAALPPTSSPLQHPSRC